MTDAEGTAVHLFRLSSRFRRAYGCDIWSADIPFDGYQAATAAEAAAGAGIRFVVGGRRGDVPALGHVVWEPPPVNPLSHPFRAYAVAAGGEETIGFLRVPHYFWEDGAFKQLETLIGWFQDHASALVLDQRLNPGGQMLHMYALASMLTERPLDVPMHEMKFWDEDITLAEETMDYITAGDAVAPEDRPSADEAAWSRFVISEIAAGRGRHGVLSAPGYVGGVSQVTPNTTRFTGRLYVLINELTFSAAEFLAAILQDNGQATLIGQRTAGAGGCARTTIRADLIPMKLTLTWTTARRTTGDYIENVGVHPDAVLEFTQEDVASGEYGLFRHRLLEIIKR
jgi:hypothetical protein